MPIGKSLNKVTKVINKKKGAGKALHANSRDAKRLHSASAREQRISEKKGAHEKGTHNHSTALSLILTANVLLILWPVNRIVFFRTILLTPSSFSNPENLSIPDLQSLIKTYLSRHDDQLSTLAAERKALGASRPPTPREIRMKEIRDQEEREYASGFWIPDLSDKDTRRLMEDWKGSWEGLGQMKFMRVTKDGEKKASSFPPSGNS